MPTSSALRSGIKNYARYLNVLSGTEPYVEPAATAYDLLETTILTSDQSTVTFSSLSSTYGSTYQHLQVRLVARSGRNAANSPIFVQFNSSGGTAYASHNLLGTESGVFGENFTSKALIERAGNVAGAQASANVFAANIIDILDPFETTKNTTLRGIGGGHYAGSGNIIGIWSGFWNNTSAVDSIQFTDYAGTHFATGSRFSLYGVKAS